MWKRLWALSTRRREIFGDLRITFVSSSTVHRTPGRLIVSGGAEWGGSNIGIVLAVKVHCLEDGTWCSAVQCIIVCVGDEVTEIIQQSLQCIFTKTKRWTFSERTSGGGGGGRDQIKCIYLQGLIMERLYMEAQDGLKTIAPPLFLNIFFYFLLV